MSEDRAVDLARSPDSVAAHPRRSQQHPNPEVTRSRDEALHTMLARFEAGRALLPPANG